MMKEELREIGDSGAKHISFRGERVNKEQPVYNALPKAGEIILYNEVFKCHVKSGSPSHGKRGVGVVKEYIRYNVYIEVFVTPTYKRVECFQIEDFRNGLVVYVNLKDKLYVGTGYGYVWADLDIKAPHEDIIALMSNSSEEIVLKRNRFEV